MSFTVLRDAIAKRFAEMCKTDLFCASVEKDVLWDRYLGSFPEGTNPVFRKRTMHDCSCCRGFIKTIGNAVSISDTGAIVSVWDVQIDDPVYQTVANAMAALVRANPIKSIFLHYEPSVGTKLNYEQGDGNVISWWEHFHVDLPVRRNTGKNIVVKIEEVGELKGKAHALYDVFSGGLEKITIDALDITLELIGQNSLYRGAENEKSIREFRKLKVVYDALPEDDRDNFAWAKSASSPMAVTQIKNTAIGTLLVNLSEDDDLEASVGKYEASVSALNYRRSSALVTKVQVDKARAAIEELGLTSALNRRYARLPDISVRNVLFADRSVSKAMKGGDVFDLINVKSTAAPKLDRVEEISIDKFLSDVLPNATSVEILFENRHVRNLMSLIAPVDPLAKKLFKWDNPYSWTYTGDATDSIKERVKKAGGNVIGELCCRLAWYNYDDLDFHMREPNGLEISFMRRTSNRTGGSLDVDMNAGSGKTREPVENIFYPSIARMEDGVYNLSVVQFTQRESVDVGFDIEIDHLGEVMSLSYDKLVKGSVNVAKITKSSSGLIIEPTLPVSSSSKSKTVWGLNTNEFHKVNSIMLSPNYWQNNDGVEEGIGAKHFFFMLDGAVNEDVARGFYNEFLHPDLNPHRKVLEMVGAKMKTDESKDQLSGVGFIATARNNIVVRVSGAMKRVVKVNF